jgi:hypothetical protein
MLLDVKNEKYTLELFPCGGVRGCLPLLLPFPTSSYLGQPYTTPPHAYLSHYLAGQPTGAIRLTEKKKRNRTFIDPVSEVC